MEVLKFTLSGKTAFFKIPDVNSYLYFTYGNIHKVSLLGILGAIMGYGGYNQQQDLGTKKTKVYPEFYEKLKDIKLAIVPLNEKGYNIKKIQTFNNSVGYASQEQGGNLIVKEQWLENPKWDIYILMKNELTKELADRIKNYRFKYIPYLGKNDHLADIYDIEIIQDAKKINNTEKLHSLFIKKYFLIDLTEGEDELEDDESKWKYEENLPIALEEETNRYELETFVLTNGSLSINGDNDLLIYDCQGKSIFFF